LLPGFAWVVTPFSRFGRDAVRRELMRRLGGVIGLAVLCAKGAMSGASEAPVALGSRSPDLERQHGDLPRKR
jgi:hypothetical protein